MNETASQTSEVFNDAAQAAFAFNSCYLHYAILVQVLVGAVCLVFEATPPVRSRATLSLKTPYYGVFVCAVRTAYGLTHSPSTPVTCTMLVYDNSG